LGEGWENANRLEPKAKSPLNGGLAFLLMKGGVFHINNRKIQTTEIKSFYEIIGESIFSF